MKDTESSHNMNATVDGMQFPPATICHLHMCTAENAITYPIQPFLGHPDASHTHPNHGNIYTLKKQTSYIRTCRVCG